MEGVGINWKSTNSCLTLLNHTELVKIVAYNLFVTDGLEKRALKLENVGPMF